MRKGQLIRKLLLHYKSSIAVIKTTPKYEEDFNKLIYYVRDRKIAHGVCMCTYELLLGKIDYNILKISTYGAKWVTKYNLSKENNVWGKFPHMGTTYSEVLQYLQTRVDNLEKELLSGDKLHQRINSKNYYV